MAIADLDSLDGLPELYPRDLPSLEEVVLAGEISLTGTQYNMARLLFENPEVPLARKDMIARGEGLLPERRKEFSRMIKSLQESRLGDYIHEVGYKGTRKYWFGIGQLTMPATDYQQEEVTSSPTGEGEEIIEINADNWHEFGRCRAYPTYVFFPTDGAGVEVARRICAGCPVKKECLEYALEGNIDHGIWGGESERRRRTMRRQRRLAASQVPPLL